MALLYNILTLALIPTGICALLFVLGLFIGFNFPLNAMLAAFAFPAILLARWYIKSSTKCPKCKKDFVVGEVDSQPVGAPSNSYRKGDGHTYEKRSYLKTYRCSSCGHEFQKTVEVEKRLN